MLTLQSRAQIDFPAGANSSDTVVNGQHYNLTTLDQYDFVLFDNGTLSNGSWCYLVLPSVESMPTIFPNGTILNGTSCYIPFYGIKHRGSTGIAFGVLFAISIMFSLLCLHRHGSLFLPQEKRFRAIGRRWQWYWMLFVAACGTISSISAIDVDRNYLLSSGIIIQALFWYLMIPGLLAAVWEGARHWGSWQERQVYDRDPFSLRHSDRRARVEFWIPLVFYLFAWLNFFMNIPRNWLNLQAQADAWQISAVATPNATDNRFKAGAILAFIAWALIVFSLWHSIHQYRLRDRSGLLSRSIGCMGSIPIRFVFTLPLLLVTIGYAEAQGWLWSINIGRQDVNSGFLYGLGYGPPLLILYINIIDGLRTPNEDLTLIKQRIARGQAIDAELGLRRPRKPWWWRKVATEIGMSNEAKLRGLVVEASGGRAQTGVELDRLRRISEDDKDRGEGNANRTSGAMVNPFRDDVGGEERERSRFGLLDVHQRGMMDERTLSDSEGSDRWSATSQARPQQVRCMLDV